MFANARLAAQTLLLLLLVVIDDGECERLVNEPDFASDKAFSAREVRTRQPPNIIVFMGDDIGFDDVGFHGSTDVVTPNLDALAADGIVIPKYYTSPLCSPSRSAFLSGVHPIHSGEQHFVIENAEPRGFSLQFPLLPQLLKQQGNYSTHLIGKWNLGFYRQIYTPLYRGFDSFYGYYGSKIDYFTHVAENFGKLGLDLRRDRVPARRDEGFATDLFTERALRIIERHEPQTPLYLHVAYPNTHRANSYDPLQAPKNLIEKFAFLKDPKRRIYAANLYSMDNSIGSVFKALANKGLLENTIVVFTSDNGAGDRGIFPNSGSNRPLRGVKGTVWEGALRVPAFIWSPLFANSSRSLFSGLFHVSDWLPTLLDATGRRNSTRDEFAYGVSQWESLLSRDSRPPRSQVLHNIDPFENVSAIRDGDMKLVKGAIHPEVSGWYGERLTNNHERVQALRELSPVRRVLARMSRRPDFDGLRKSRITCDNKTPVNNCQPNVQACLFNITEDPCERNDLANDYPTIASHLEELLDRFTRSAVEPRNRPLDPRSDPAFHDGTWVSWDDSSSLMSTSASSLNVYFRVAAVLQLCIAQLCTHLWLTHHRI